MAGDIVRTTVGVIPVEGADTTIVAAEAAAVARDTLLIKEAEDINEKALEAVVKTVGSSRL